MPTLALVDLLPSETVEDEDDDDDHLEDDNNAVAINIEHDRKSLADHRRDILALMDDGDRLHRGTSWSELKSAGRRLSSTPSRLLNRRSFPDTTIPSDGRRSCDASGEESDALPLLDRMTVSLHQTPPLSTSSGQRKRRLAARNGSRVVVATAAAAAASADGWLQNASMTTSIYEPAVASPQLMTRSLNVNSTRGGSGGSNGKRRLLRRRLIRRAASDAGGGGGGGDDGGGGGESALLQGEHVDVMVVVLLRRLLFVLTGWPAASLGFLCNRSIGCLHAFTICVLVTNIYDRCSLVWRSSQRLDRQRFLHHHQHNHHHNQHVSRLGRRAL